MPLAGEAARCSFSRGTFCSMVVGHDATLERILRSPDKPPGPPPGGVNLRWRERKTPPGSRNFHGFELNPFSCAVQQTLPEDSTKLVIAYENLRLIRRVLAHPSGTALRLVTLATVL